LTRSERGWAARFTSLVAGALGGEPKDMSRSSSHVIDHIVATLHRLDERQLEALATEWHRESADARSRGWLHAKQVIGEKRVTDALARAREDIALWSGARPNDYTGVEGLMGRPTPELNERRVAGLAALDAVVALLAEGELATEEHDALYGPWQRVASDGTKPTL